MNNPAALSREVSEGFSRDLLNLKDVKLSLFSFAWAVATLFHMANKRTFEDELHLVVLSLIALFLIYKPSSLFRLVLLIGFQLFEAFKAMPGLSNHWIFTTFVNITILYCLLYVCIKNRSFKVNRSELYQMFAPMVRIEVLILYFYVVFHKLNTGFFHIDTSCASYLYLSQNTGSLLPQTEFFLALNAYFTIFIEAFIPLLLFFRKTRNWGILAGLLFHNVIAYNSYNGFYDFSSMIFAAYILFSDDRFATKALNLYSNGKEKLQQLKERFEVFSLKKLGVIMVLFICSFMILFTLTKRFEDFYRLVIWTAYSLTFISVFVFSLLSQQENQPSKNFYKPLHWSFLLFPAIVFLNGLSPYLGLKTENSFAMFSNLRTEGRVSNHLIVPASSQVFHLQDDLVEITSSSDPVLQEYADHQKMLVISEFRHLVAQQRPEKVEFIRAGKAQTFTLATASVNDEYLQGNSFLFRKLFRFRPVSKAELQPCSH